MLNQNVLDVKFILQVAAFKSCVEAGYRNWRGRKSRLLQSDTLRQH